MAHHGAFWIEQALGSERGVQTSSKPTPSHLTDIDNTKSSVIEQLSTIQKGRFDTGEDIQRKQEKANRYTEQKFCDAGHYYSDETALGAGKQTLFVNASIKGDDDMPIQLPWLVELGLPRTETRRRHERPDEPVTVGKKRCLDADPADSEQPLPKRRKIIANARKEETGQ